MGADAFTERDRLRDKFMMQCSEICKRFVTCLGEWYAKEPDKCSAVLVSRWGGGGSRSAIYCSREWLGRRRAGVGVVSHL